jgi:hypothetical protein
MADYHPVLARAVAALEDNTAEARREVYERARAAIVRKLRSYEPPLTESEITRERLALEDAVRRIEREIRAQQKPERPAPGGAGLQTMQAAAADAAALGAAAASAQVSANAARALLDGDEGQEAPRVEPRFEPAPARGAAAGPLAPPVRETVFDKPEYPGNGNGNGESSVPFPPLPRAEEPARSRGPAITGIFVVIALLALGLGAYAMRDTLSGMLGGKSTGTEATVPESDAAPKITDRVGGAPTTNSEPADASQQTATAPATQPSTTAAPETAAPAAPSSVAPVAQRATLYEEAPDRQGGTASTGTVVWSVEKVAGKDGAPEETQLRGAVDLPDPKIKMTLLVRRNTDATLPASHTIDIQFQLPPDFANGGIANVPGILFKNTEEAGGTALSGLSVRVMNNFFLIGLSNAPADRAKNLGDMRDDGWIDLPILFENGRRAVLTLEKGPPGEQAFKEAMEAWSKAEPVAQQAAPETPQQ